MARKGAEGKKKQKKYKKPKKSATRDESDAPPTATDNLKPEEPSTSTNPQAPSESNYNNSDGFSSTSTDGDTESKDANLRYRKIAIRFPSGSQNPDETPPGYPHIISSSFTEQTDRKNLRLADGVATVIFNFDPKALQAFLNISRIPGFSFHRLETKPSAKDLFIERKDYSVMCGFKNKHDQWDPHLEFRIEETGMWTPVEMSIFGPDFSSSKDPKLVQQSGQAFAMHILVNKQWKGGKGVKFICRAVRIDGDALQEGDDSYGGPAGESAAMEFESSFPASNRIGWDKIG